MFQISEKKLLDVQLEKEEENVALNAAESHESDGSYHDNIIFTNIIVLIQL